MNQSEEQALELGEEEGACLLYGVKTCDSCSKHKFSSPPLGPSDFYTKLMSCKDERYPDIPPYCFEWEVLADSGV